MKIEGRGRTRVDLFNFSFLDVLACTIGLLIFIMTIIAITSSSPGNPKAAARLAKLGEMQKRAQTALARAHLAEAHYANLLSQRAAQTLNLKDANRHIRRQIARLERQTADYKKLTAKTNASITAVRQQLKKAKRLNNPSKAEKLAQQIKLTQQQVAQTEKQIATLAKLRAEHTVKYYIPYVRKTTRNNVLFEVANNRIWRIGSKDFHRTKYHLLLETYEKYVRRSGAVPDTLAQFISPTNPPRCLRTNSPKRTVLVFMVHPSGFGTYSALELWARNKKYAVNWHPTDATRTFTFHLVSAVPRQ